MNNKNEFNIRKHLQIKIKPLPKKLYNYLQKIKTRILDNMDLLESYLSKNNLPNNINNIDIELQKLSTENGILNLNFTLTKLDLFLIFGSSQYQYLKQINFSNIKLDFNPQKYEQAIENFENLFNCSCPHEFLMIYDLIDKSNEILGKNLELDLDILSYDYYGLSTYIFNKTIPENALILHKHGDHELNYIPYATYHSDGVTYGLIYDYFNKKFDTSVYNDINVNSYDNLLSSFIEKFQDIWKYSKSLNGYYESYTDEELIDHITIKPSEQLDFDETIFNLTLFTLSYLIHSYLIVNPIPKHSISKRDRLRYKSFFLDEDKKKLEHTFNNSYIFRKTYPVTPIPHSILEETDNKVVGNIISTIESICDLYSRICPDNRFCWYEKERYSDLRRILKSSELLNFIPFHELLDYFEKHKRYNKKEKEIIFNLLSTAIEDVYSFANESIKINSYGYAFMISILFWTYCPNGSLSKLAVNILSQLDPEFLPPFILKTAKLHCDVRFDKDIPT